jgi:hypothetical protein
MRAAQGGIGDMNLAMSGVAVGASGTIQSFGDRRLTSL